MVRALVIADGDMAEKGNATNFFERHLPTNIMALHYRGGEDEVEYSTNKFRKFTYNGDPDSIIALI